ncbi:rpoE leader peptide RseD [Klebsiella oxytoca]|nr:rpoE leader peptide RseD [Klebsiella oxytoca]HCB1497953.1 rpoE leader peptide RseD [Klebsiella michiganensis]HCB1843648.1 rpoE leader peptide RseD [Klebsiella oxytoca]
MPDEKKRRNGTLLFSDTQTLSLLIYAVIGWCFEYAWELGLGRHYLG